MDIAAMAMGLSQMKVAQEASMSVMKMAMDNSQTGLADLLEVLESSARAMELSVNPHLGGNMDIHL